MKRRPPVAQFCALDHVMISPDGGGFLGVTDEALARVGLTRRVVLSVPHFLFVISVLASTDLVAMLPLRLVCGLGGSLRMVDPPIVRGRASCREGVCQSVYDTQFAVPYNKTKRIHVTEDVPE